MQQNIKVNDTIILQIKRMGINGEGIGYHERLAIFVEHALPGEQIEAQITEVFDNRAYAKLVKIVKESKDRTQPFCPVYDACGGCQTQHYDYDAMLKQKRDILLKAFDRYIGKDYYHLIKDTIGMENPLNYRNKANLPVRMIDGKNKFGMFARNSSEFIAIDECGIQHELVNAILNTIVELMDIMDIEGYDPETKKGTVLSLVVRITENVNEAQVSFIVSEKTKNLEALTKQLIFEHPEIVSVFEVINEDKRQAFFTEHAHKIYGKETITEMLNGYEFELKADAFFQLNTAQADKFYQVMKKLAALSEDDVVLDVYSGTNPVSHYIRQKVGHITAVPLDKNNPTNILSFSKNETQILLEGIESLAKINDKVDTLLLDASRAGLGFKGLEYIKKIKPNRIVYGSSNPSTLGKDLEQLLKDYKLVEVVPIDMFPYTSLVESISMLELKEPNKAIKKD